MMTPTALARHDPYSTVVSQDSITVVLRLLCAVPPSATYPRRQRRRSILELQGLGKEIWQGIDATQYVRDLRDEWDAR